jgi:tetratricopeptide (TPR) repeat protein
MGSARKRVSGAGTRARRAAVGRESLEERWLLEAQTARNLEAMAAEQAGQIDEAIALYERNAAEGFAGELPYGRLVALYERRAAFDQAERVLRRAIEVFEASTRRTAQDRRATIRVFKNRLAALLKRRGSSGTVC